MNKITICLRVYPGIADKQKVFCNDKLTIYKKSLSSLILSCGNLAVKYIILLDCCPSEYLDFTKSILSGQDYEIISYDKKQGNATTFAKQVDILCNADTDIVYFAEDDYLYLPGAIQKFYYDFQKNKAGFGTIYYSPDYDILPLHNYKPLSVEYNNRQYIYMASTTMTFFAKKYSLLNYKKRLLTYASGNHDFSMRFTITKYNIFNINKFIIYLFTNIRSCKLWLYIRYKCNVYNLIIKKDYLMLPKKSGATHIDDKGLAPGYNRKQLWNSL